MSDLHQCGKQRDDQPEQKGDGQKESISKAMVRPSIPYSCVTSMPK